MAKRKSVKKEMKDNTLTRGKDDKCRCGSGCGCGGALYGLGFIGAVVYYIATATGFWGGVLGVLKAIVWPAFLVYGLLKQLGM